MSGTQMELEEESYCWLFEDEQVILWGEEDVTYTLFDLTYMVAREMGITIEGIATSGATTTIIDTNDRTEDNDYWNGGTAWILRDALGASAAPEGQYSVISDHTSAGTVTLRDALTAAVAVGDRYAVADDKVPLHIIIQKINQALTDLGAIPYTDTTSVTIADDKTEYTLPAAANLDLRAVYIQMEDDDTNDNQWREILTWSVERQDPGNADLLILQEQYLSGYDLKLEYMANHADLFTYTDPLSEHVPAERVIYPAIVECLKYRKQRTRWRDFDADIARYEAKAEQVRQTRPIRQLQRSARLMIVGDTPIEYESEPGKVYL